MRKVLLVAVLLITTTTAFGKTHDYEMEAPCGHVWAAIRDVLMHSGKYGILFINDKDMNASYNIGGYLSGRRTNSVQLSRKENNCTMSVQTVFSGIVNKDAQDFLGRVKEAMKRVPPPSPEAEAEETAGPAETGAKIEIVSKPEGADIELDGNFAGNTPSTVGVKPGEHTVKVIKKGYKPWERTITTSSGTIKLSPELEAIEVMQESKPQ